MNTSQQQGTNAADLKVGDVVRRTNGIGGTGVVVSTYSGPDYEPYATVRMDDGEWSGTGEAWTRVAAEGPSAVTTHNGTEYGNRDQAIAEALAVRIERATGATVEVEELGGGLYGATMTTERGSVIVATEEGVAEYASEAAWMDGDEAMRADRGGLFTIAATASQWFAIGWA